MFSLGKLLKTTTTSSIKNDSKFNNVIFESFFIIQQASLLNAQNKRRRREQEMADREQLLSRRFGHDHTAINVDFLGQEQASLQNSHRNVDEMLHTGTFSFKYLVVYD